MNEQYRDPELLAEIVRQLIGPINPVGKTEVDEARYDNLELLIGTMNILLDDVQEVSCHKTAPEYSVSRAGKYAYEFILMLNQMGD